MKKVLSIFFIFTITTLPALATTSTSSDTTPAVESQNSTLSTETMTVSGTVLGENNQPLTDAAISIPGTTKGTTTDLAGKFELKNVPANAELEVSFLGYQTQNITPGKNLTVQMAVSQITLNEVAIVACRGDKANGIKSKKLIDGECYPSACVEPRWTLSGTDKNTKCVEQKCVFKHGTGKWEQNGDTWECKLTACDTAKGWKKNDAGNACIEMLDECTDEQKAAHPHATQTALDSARNCIALDCQCGYDVQNGACVAWPIDENGKSNKPCDDNQLKKLNAKSGIVYCENDTAKCEIIACISDDYTHNTQNNTCDNKNKQPCTHGDKNATDAEYKNIDGKLTCFINDCRAGYTPNSDGTACTPQRVLSESDSQAQIDELKDNAQKMKAKEQSTANKLLGAVGIGATGIGGMQLASAMAEENADADAERAMRAYLATFHCNYGGGKNIKGGERDIELPGGNELIGLYSEYVNLANDLKVRKTALDMRPGIESEPILDAATSGLYDDVAIGKTSGAYTSLARALMDPNGADAAAWAQQRADTADKKQAGLITAGIGAAGSLVGNLAINSGKNKQNKLDEILNKFDKKRQLITELESNIAALPPQIVPCPAGTTGEKQPDCTCTDNKKFFNPKTTTCEDCPGDLVAIDGKCTCEGANKRVVDNQCQTVTVETVTTTETILTETETITGAILPTDSLFDLGKSTLRSEAQSHISNFIKKLSENGYTNCSIKIDGYTDPLGETARNKTLSQQRADAVKKYISGLNNSAITSITATGHGETDCTCGAGTAQNRQIDYDNYEYSICKGKAAEYQLTGEARYAPCRRVVITPTCDKTTMTVTKKINHPRGKPRGI